MQNDHTEASDITDEQWARVRPLLPRRGGIGRPRADDRQTLNGVLYVIGRGCRWRDLPRRYGSHITCWRRHKRWAQNGTWDQVLGLL
jgi:transposase